MFENLDELEKKFKVTAFPLNVIIEPTNYCNLNCIMCSHDKMTRKKGNINIVLYKKIIDEIAKENVNTRIWLDFFGEPLLQKFKIFYLINYAKNKGLTNVCLNTNATLLDDEIAEMLLDSKLDFLSIDCDGFSKTVFEKIRKNANRDVVFANIDNFLNKLSVRKKNNEKVPIVDVKVIDMPENHNEVQQIMNYWQAKGAWTTRRRLISWGSSVDSVTLNPNHSRIVCGNAVGTLPIMWDGKVVICAMDTNAEYVLGNVAEQSIKEIWHSRNNNFLNKHFEHKWNELPEICRNCNDWSIVGEERFDENGNIIEKSYDTVEEELFSVDIKFKKK